MAIESKVFPWAFAALAARGLWGILGPLPTPQLGKRTLLEASGVLAGFLVRPDTMPLPPGLSRAQVLSLLALGILHPVLGFVFNAACATLLALRARIRVEPSRWREVLVPTTATFLLLLVSLSDRFPSWMTRPLPVPPAWGLPLLGIAAVLTIGGLTLALWGLAYLRGSFSVFVEVRRVVSGGPYRFIRHPLYAGEITMAAGLWLSRPTLFGALVVVVLAALQVLRAGMEEARLSAADPAYAEGLGTTGGFLPRLRPRAART